jgi:hypothetical protein
MTESYMEKPAFTRACLSDIKLILVIMHVPFIELLCQVVMGWILALKYLLSGMCGAYGHALSCQTVNVATSQDQAPGEMLHAHIYYNEEKVTVWIILGFSSF